MTEPQTDPDERAEASAAALEALRLLWGWGYANDARTARVQTALDALERALAPEPPPAPKEEEDRLC